MGISAGHQWAVTWPPMGSFSWPLTSDGTELKKFHLSFTPALKQALVVEAGLSGITQTELIREAVLAWISPRIDQRNQQTTVQQ